MNESRIWRWSLVVALGAGAVGLWQLSAQPAAAQPKGAAPGCCVGVIDLNTVLESMEERKVRENELQDFIKTKQARLEDMKKQTQSAQSDLKVLPQRGKEWFSKRDEVAGLAISLRGEEELAKAQVEEKRKLMSLELFSKIKEAAARYASQQGYSVVISSDASVDIPDEMPEQQVQAAMVARRLMYANDGADISANVAQMLNNEFKAK